MSTVLAVVLALFAQRAIPVRYVDEHGLGPCFMDSASSYDPKLVDGYRWTVATWHLVVLAADGHLKLFAQRWR